MKHPEEIANYSGSLEDLATEIGNLRYDALARFLNLLSRKIERDAGADAVRGRTQLSGCLTAASEDLSEAGTAIEQAWKICKPYMKQEIADEKT